MQSPDLLSCILTKNCLLNRFTFYLIWILSRTLNYISEINRNTLFRRSDDFILENTCEIAVTSGRCSIKYRYPLVLLLRNRPRCLFIVLDIIKLNEIKYARKSIYHVFLVWMASLVTAYAALRPRNGFSHPHQEHMKDTYKPIFKIYHCTVYEVNLPERSDDGIGRVVTNGQFCHPQTIAHAHLELSPQLSRKDLLIVILYMVVTSLRYYHLDRRITPYLGDLCFRKYSSLRNDEFRKLPLIYR